MGWERETLLEVLASQPIGQESEAIIGLILIDISHGHMIHDVVRNHGRKWLGNP